MPVMGMFEKGFEVALNSPNDMRYVALRTFDQQFTLLPNRTGSIIVHTGLSRLVTFEPEPAGGAAIGISEIGGQVFSPDSEWRASLYIDANVQKSFTISANVFRGEMRGWWYIQVWS